MSLGYINIRVSLCEVPSFVRWKRNHRKSRINKKWHKRYGAEMKYCKGVAYRVGREFFVCPCMNELLKKELEK